MKRTIGPLDGDGIRLRLLAQSDLPLTRVWRNQDRIRKWFFHSAPVTAEGHLAWYTAYADRDDDFVFVIEETRDLRRAIGQVALYHIDWTTGRAEYGRLMIGDDEAAGRGLAHRATTRLLAEAFGPLQLREIVLEVMPENAAALSVYHKCGFAIEGVTAAGAIRMVTRK